MVFTESYIFTYLIYNLQCKQMRSISIRGNTFALFCIMIFQCHIVTFFSLFRFELYAIKAIFIVDIFKGLHTKVNFQNFVFQ